MIFKITLVAIFGVAFAQNSDVETLKRLTDEGRAAVGETLANIMNTPNKFDHYIEGRLDSLKWEGVAQKQLLNKTIAEAVFKGMLKKKQFNNFQCISTRAQETESKIDAISSQIPSNSESIKEKGLLNVMPFRLIAKGLDDYVQDLFKTKSEELIKTQNESAKKKIVVEVMEKMKHLDSILGQINKHLNTSLFVFFEKYVNYAFATENSLRTTQRNGASEIIKCVS